MQDLQQVLPLHSEAEEPYKEEAHWEDTIFLWECNQYYGDSQSLKVHMRKYTPEGEEVSAHKCNTCGETYPSIGKLNQHSQKHEDIRCSMCGKGFAYIQTKKAHEEESCPNRPGLDRHLLREGRSQESHRRSLESLQDYAGIVISVTQTTVPAGI